MDPSRLFHLKPCLLILALVAVLGGCAHNERPLLIERYDSHGEAYLYKRFERQPVQDFWHHWTSAAYMRPTAKAVERVGRDGIGLVEQLGEPDWIRRPFKSIAGLKVDEWIYLSEDRLFQFAEGQLIFEGFVTDYERILLERGYPDKANVISTEDNMRIDVFYYRHMFWAQLDQYHFVNGQINQSQEGS